MAPTVNSASEDRKLREDQRQNHRVFFRRLRRFVGFSFHTSSTFMAYLHGDVPKGEEEAACAYEYARESIAAWRVAHRRDKLIARSAASPGSMQSLESNVLTAIQEYAAFSYCRPDDARRTAPALHAWVYELLRLESFPRADWLELSEQHRQFFRRAVVTPLRMTNVVVLNALGVFDQFKKMGETGPSNRDSRHRPLPLLQYQESPIYRAVFDLDFSKSTKRLLNEFEAWLNLPENQERAKKHKVRKEDTGRPLDRLKNLAAWRLFRELNNDYMAANAFANENRRLLNPRERRPFRDAKPDKAGKRTREAADLFAEEADAFQNQTKALEYLAELLPTDECARSRAP